MKKILILLFLVVCIGKLNAQTITLTKVTASVTSSYSGNRKDTILKNNARITSNLLPITNFLFNVKWTALIINPSEPQDVVISLYDPVNNMNLYSRTLSMNIFGSNDSTTIVWSPNFASSPIGNAYTYCIRITHKANASTINIDEKSNSWNCSYIDDPNKIYYNAICCSKIVTLPYQPTDSLRKDPNVGTATTTATHLPIKYIWERSINGGAFLALPGATNASYLPQLQTQDTRYRRIAIAYNGVNQVSNDISNIVSFARGTCTRPTTTANEICGDQGFYNLKDGDVIYPTKIIGSYIPWPASKATPPPAIQDTYQGYEYLISYGGDWYTQGGIIELSMSGKRPDDFKMDPIVFHSSNGPEQHVYIQRKYYELYDEWS